MQRQLTGLEAGALTRAYGQAQLEYWADGGERDDRLTTDERVEPASLRKGNAQPKRANEALRTASAFFAAQVDPAQVTALLDEHPHLEAEPVLRDVSIASSACCRCRRAEREPREHRCRDVDLTEHAYPCRGR
ncbi:hypothetical protein OG250_42050 [Streptomyces sp. NBC_00487]|uniref:hypothetical protein n=1 Tax=Streptomyces sp. NBC_00487 TaxID=2903656 RepID=UPI002E1846F5